MCIVLSDVFTHTHACSLSLSLSLSLSPDGYKVPLGSGQFAFLLDQNTSPDSLPPSYVGCVDAITRNGQPFGLEDADSSQNLLIGLCPAEV